MVCGPSGNWCRGVGPGIVVFFLLVAILTVNCGTGLRWEVMTTGTMMLASVVAE